MTKEKVEAIMRLPYTRELIANGDGTWFASVLEFTGCMTEGDTQVEALANLDDAMAGWIEVRLEDGLDIPEPITDEQFSGKFNVRVPRSLHRDLARRADREGVSLNQIVVSALSRAVGLDKKRRPR